MTRHEKGSLVALVLSCILLLMEYVQKCVTGAQGYTIPMGLAVLCLVVSAGTFLLDGLPKPPIK